MAIEKDKVTAEILRRNFDNIDRILNPGKVLAINDSAVNFFKNPHYADLIYFDPPWGGKNYKDQEVELKLDDIGIGVLIGDILYNGYAALVVLKVPVNANLDKIILDINIENLTDVIYDVYNETTNKIDYSLIFFRADNNFDYYEEEPYLEVELKKSRYPPFPGIVIASLINEYNVPYFFFGKDKDKSKFDKFKGYNDLDTHLKLWLELFKIIGPNLDKDYSRWAKTNSLNAKKIADLLTKITELTNIIDNVIVGKFDDRIYSLAAKNILKVVYNDLIITHKSKLTYANSIGKEYLLNDKTTVNELVDKPPNALLILNESGFRDVRFINFAVDVEHDRYGREVKRAIKKNVKASEFGVIKDDALDILANIDLKQNPLLGGPVNIYSADISIVEKITGLKGDLLDILTQYSGKTPDGKWAAKSDRSESRYDKFLKNMVVNTYLDVGSGDGRDALIVADRVKAKRVILADVHDYRVDNEGELLLIYPNKPINLEDVDLITGFHFLHHSTDAIFRLNDLYRILKPGGYLLIKDHDVVNLKDANNVSFEHFVYSLGENKASIDDARIYQEIEPMFYYGAKFMIDYIVNLGMELVLLEEYKNLTKVYVALFRKI
jgi:SAM-dependent methyltransferase